MVRPQETLKAWENPTKECYIYRNSTKGFVLILFLGSYVFIERKENDNKARLEEKYKREWQNTSIIQHWDAQICVIYIKKSFSFTFSCLLAVSPESGSEVIYKIIAPFGLNKCIMMSFCLVKKADTVFVKCMMFPHVGNVLHLASRVVHPLQEFSWYCSCFSAKNVLCP